MSWQLLPTGQEMNRLARSLIALALGATSVLATLSVGAAPPAAADESDGDIDYVVYDRVLSWEPRPADPSGKLYFAADYKVRCPATTDLIDYRESFSDRGQISYQFDGRQFANRFRNVSVSLTGPVAVGPMVVTWICGRIVDDQTYAPLAAANIKFTVVAPPPFRDMPPGAFYEGAVRRAVASGLTGGTTATTFEPDAGVSRWQMATFLQRLARQSGEPAPGVIDSFRDTGALAGSFREAIGWLDTANVTKGCDRANNFCPNSGVTRAQMALFLQRFYKGLGGKVTVSADTFTDTGGLPPEFKQAIGWLAKSGVTQGCSATEFCPNQIVSRWQMVVFLDRMTDLLENS